MLERPLDYGDWLPGGFLFCRPWLIYRDTQHYRSGELRLFRESVGSGRVEPIPWPPSFVVVGHHGDGAVVIDTADDRQLLHDIYKENYTLRPFLNVQEVAESPQAFAAMLLAAEEQRTQRKARGT